jgi:2-dehydropantoate 2-reductase
MKILLFGAGAVGGYFGAKLSKPADVTLIARGKRLEAMKKSGLTLRNAADGTEEHYLVNAQEKPQGFYDLIIIAVKSADTHTAAEICKPHLAPQGSVLSLQNGAGSAALLAEIFGLEKVIGGVVTSGISVPEAGVILYEPYPSLKLGSLSGDKNQEDAAAKLFTDAGLKCRISEDIKKDIWAKAVWNIAYNPLSALMQATCGELTENIHSNVLMRTIIAEAVTAAQYHGVELPENIADITLSLNPIYKNYKTSAFQDVLAGRPPETEGLMGPVVSLAEKGLIAAPATEAIYQLCRYKFDRWFHIFPRLAADVLVVNRDKVLLIERKYPPFGWAIPGGLVDYGEKIEDAAVRELEEECGIKLTVDDITLLGIYSDPARDHRGHTASAVYYAHSSSTPQAGDDAAKAAYFPVDDLPELAFDHARVIADYLGKIS